MLNRITLKFYNKLSKLKVLLPVLFIVFSPLFVMIPSVSAVPTLYQSIPTCVDTHLEEWDWVAGLKANMSSSFDVVNDSWFMFRVNATPYASFGTAPVVPATDRNVLRLVRGLSSSAMTLYYNSGTGLAQINYLGTINTIVDITSESVKLNPSYAHYNASLGVPSYANEKGQSVGSGSTSSYGQHSLDFTSGGINGSCMVAMHKIAVDSSFSSNFLTYNTTQSYSVKGKTGCAWNDISCMLSNVSQEMAGWFVPDSTAMGDIWSNFTSTMTANLGVLVYPITFVTDVFTAFATPTTTCTVSSCNIVSTTFMGGAFNIDAATLHNKLPTVWTFVDGAIIGLTMYALIVSIYHRYIKLVSKG